MKTEILVAEAPQLAEAFATRLELVAAQAIEARGRFALALPGGSAGETFFPRLARSAVDWSRSDFYWSDERAVAADDPRSNFVLADRLWLRPAGVPAANLHRLPADRPDLEQAAVAAESELIALLGDPPRLDILWLGVGEDGHVASLFPDDPLLDERRRFVAALRDSPKPPPGRLTLTLPAIGAARCVVVTALGAGKASAIGAALGDGDSRLPLALALAVARRSWLLLDAASARDLPARSLAKGPRR